MCWVSNWFTYSPFIYLEAWIHPLVRALLPSFGFSSSRLTTSLEVTRRLTSLIYGLSTKLTFYLSRDINRQILWLKLCFSTDRQASIHSCPCSGGSTDQRGVDNIAAGTLVVNKKIIAIDNINATSFLNIIRMSSSWWDHACSLRGQWLHDKQVSCNFRPIQIPVAKEPQDIACRGCRWENWQSPNTTSELDAFHRSVFPVRGGKSWTPEEGTRRWARLVDRCSGISLISNRLTLLHPKFLFDLVFARPPWFPKRIWKSPQPPKLGAWHKSVNMHHYLLLFSAYSNSSSLRTPSSPCRPRWTLPRATTCLLSAGLARSVVVSDAVDETHSCH